MMMTKGVSHQQKFHNIIDISHLHLNQYSYVILIFHVINSVIPILRSKRSRNE